MQFYEHNIHSPLHTAPINQPGLSSKRMRSNMKVKRSFQQKNPV